MPRWNEKLRTAARAKRIRYHELADMLGVTTGAVGHWMSGRREPNLEHLMQLCRTLEIDLHALLSEDPVFSDVIEIRAAHLIKQIPKEQQAAALRMLEALITTPTNPD